MPFTTGATMDQHSRKAITGERREKETFMRRSEEGSWKRAGQKPVPRWLPILLSVRFGGGVTETWMGDHLRRWVPTQHRGVVTVRASQAQLYPLTGATRTSRSHSLAHDVDRRANPVGESAPQNPGGYQSEALIGVDGYHGENRAADPLRSPSWRGRSRSVG